MNFSEMVRALRRPTTFRIVKCGWYETPFSRGQELACWILEDTKTRMYHCVPLPEGWVLPT